MSEKRRRARVQGGWASTSKPRRDEGPTKIANKDEKYPINFKFKPTVENRSKPKELVIKKNGVHQLSDTDNGLSRIFLQNEFFDSNECEWIFEQLHAEVPWKQELIKIKGETVEQPRHTAWFGDITYTYSGLTLNPLQFSPLLIMIRDKIESYMNEQQINRVPFNSMLANLYRGEKDSIDWHSDDEVSLQRNPVIASLSFGETRNFELRRKDQSEIIDGEVDYTYSQHVKVPLSNGSLLIMDGACQEDWQHRVPKEYHDRQPRINLTFRTIYPS